jgi:hypothetical protein
MRQNTADLTLQISDYLLVVHFHITPSGSTSRQWSIKCR